jgi:hypothetical protein
MDETEDRQREEFNMVGRSNDPSLTSLVRQMPNMAKSPTGKAAICALMAAFVCIVAGGASFGDHLPALGIVFAVLAGISLVALFGIGLAAVVMFVLRPVRRSAPENEQLLGDSAGFKREHPDR